MRGAPRSIKLLTGRHTPSLRLSLWTDQVGSIRVLCDESGAVLRSIEYDAFGNPVRDNRPDWDFPLGFAGGLYDSYTGLVRFGLRDYIPDIGRFTAKDPLGDTGGDHDLWDYCVDDPVSRVDPNGLWWDPWDESRVPRKDNGQFDSTGGSSQEAKKPQDKGESKPTKEDDRSLVGKGLAAFSPLLFGNEEEKKQKKESLTRSIKKEVEGMVDGFVQILDPEFLEDTPTSNGDGVMKMLSSKLPDMGGKSFSLREGYKEFRKRKAKTEQK
jgi:RHS repeat-associated protein